MISLTLVWLSKTRPAVEKICMVVKPIRAGTVIIIAKVIIVTKN